MSKGHYNRLVSEHSRELLEGTVGAIARNAKEDGVDKGTRRERERIIATLNERIKDLESCTKDDGCQVRADGIRLAISDIEFKGEGNWADSVQEMKKDWPE